MNPCEKCCCSCPQKLERMLNNVKECLENGCPRHLLEDHIEGHSIIHDEINNKIYITLVDREQAMNINQIVNEFSVHHPECEVIITNPQDAESLRCTA